MKKILLILLIGMLFISCEKSPIKTYYIEYEIHYPDRTDTLSTVKKFNKEPHVKCYKGFNYIEYVNDYENGGSYYESIIETSAPLNIITIKEQK